jgi:hypothetical protein
MELMNAKLRASFTRVTALARSLKPLHVSSVIAFAGTLLLASVFLHPNPVKRSPINEPALSAAATSETSSQPAQTHAEPKKNAKRTREKLALQLKRVEASPEPKSQSEPQKFPAPGARPAQELRLSPGAPPANEEEAQAENGDEIRERGNWFHDQRAYPFAHIPSGALQEAIRQRDAMKQLQRAQSQINAQAVITFPGDALWHLMGPQPVNELFSVNSGFPTASGRVTAIAVDPSDATGQTVYIGGAAGGVWKTINAGVNPPASPTWVPLTDTQPSLAIGCITIDPNNHNTIYVGTGEENFNGDAFYGAGILKSTDGGTTWTQMGAIPFAQVLGPQTGGALIGQIAVQPGNPNIVLAAVSFFVGGTVGGIYRSTDGGSTWAEDASPHGVAATQVVFESTSNAGTTATAWAAMGNPFGEAANGIYKSTDSGATWTKQAGGLPTSNLGRITLGYAPSTAGATATVYAAIADSSHSSSPLLGVFKTTNGGTAWTQVTTAPNFCNSLAPNSGQCFYDMAVGVHPTNPNFVVVGGGAFTNNSTSLFKTTDGGTTWTTSTAPNDFTLGTTSVRPHVDTHAFAFAANGATPRFYVGNDGGMWRTDNPTVTPPLWVDLNATLAITQFYPGPSAGIGDENSGFGGTQDNDTELFSGNLAWDNVFACGDGGFTAIDPNIPTTVYTTCDRGAQAIVRKSVFNGSISTGQTFNAADSGIVRTDRSQFIPPLAIDDGNPNTLYFGTFQVYQTNDGANTWNVMDVASPDLTGGNGTITNLDVAHHASSVVVAGTSNGKVWETVNATAGALATWTEIDGAPLPGRHVTSVRIPRNDSSGNTVYVTFSGFGSCAGCGATPGHVFVTTNGTAATPTWTDISGNLPDIPVNDILVSHNDNPLFDALYIATDVGVFSCPSPAISLCADWTVVGDGLPNSPVLGLAMRPSSRILRAATHGRSMWQIQLTDENPGPFAFLSSLTPAAAHVGDPTTPVSVTGGNFSTNTRVLFDGASVGTPTFVSTTQLTISVNSSLLTDGHVFKVSLTDPQGADPGTGPFTVMNPILGTPTLTNPTTTAGTPYTMHFTGSNFVNSTTVTLTTFGNFQLTGGTANATGTAFDIAVPASFLTTAMAVSGTITNPLPGGGPSPAFPVNFTINPGTIIFNPTPIALSTLLGTTSTVFNVAIINTSASSATITAQSITTPGSNPSNFSFANPLFGTTCNFPSSGQSGTGSITLAANGGTCNFGLTYFANSVTPGNAVSTATLSVTDNASGSPQTAPIQGTPISSVFLAPVNFGPVTVGTTSPTMNATLSNFSGSSINITSGFTVGGTNQADFHIVPFVSHSANPACPTAPFPLASLASCDVTLTFTPTLPAGNETAQLNVTASVSVTTSTPNLIGTGIEITSISPPIVATGGPAFTLTVNGGGFVPGSVVNVGPNGTNPRLTTFVSANELLASIPASDIATAGTLPISVTTPNPGGTTSEPKTLFIAQAPPANNDNINFALFHVGGGTTIRTASGPFVGGSTGITLIWSSPFPDTNYTAICSAETQPGDFLLPTITLRTTSSMTVVPTDGGTLGGILHCMAIPDSDTSDIRHGRVAYSGFPATVTVPWNTAFPGTGYAAACTVETQGSTTAGFTSVISALTAASVTVDNNGFATGTMHCIARGTAAAGAPSIMRRTRVAISGSPATVPVTFGAPFNLFTNDDASYAAACSDVQLGVTPSGAALAISAGSVTVNGFNVINEIPSGTLHCLAIPTGGSANSRFTEDTTQATAQSTAITSPASLATPVDPTPAPACIPAGATLQGTAKSVWQVYTAPENGTVVADTRFSSYPTILSAWTLSTALPSSSEAFAQVTCASGNVPAVGASPLQSHISFPATKGTDYYLMVSDASSTGAGGTLTFSIDFEGVAPPNDDNATPITITPAQLPYSNTINSVKASANTNSHNDPMPPCAPAGAASSGQANSIWYTFTPTSSGTIVADTLTSPYATILNVTSGTANGTQVACNASASAGIAQSQVSFAATSAVHYFFMVSSFLGDGGTTNFHLTFSAGVAGVPATIAATSGTPQSATINTAFAAPLVATVLDSSSTPVSGANVTFTAPGSGASGKFSNNTATITVATNASGVASAPFTANATAGGPYTVTATVPGVASPANFSLTNNAGAAASMTANAGTTPQSATINTAFANALAVTVKDAGSNPVSGANVTFTAPGSGASGKFSNNTATITVATNASGVASAPFTANATAGGPYTVTAAAAGLTTVNFSLTNTAGAAASMTANAGTTPQSATINTAFANALAVTVTDAGSNPISGVNVTFTAPGSGASGKFSNNTATITVATNASGVASAPFTANGTAGGPYTVTAAATGLTTVNFSLTNTAGAAASMTANAGTTPQAATINTAFANALAVTVKDAGSNPVSGVNVTFTAPGSGASGKFSNNTATITVVTNASGVASAPFTANATAGGPYTVTAAATGLTTVNFSLTNTAGAASSMTANAGTTPQSATISTAFANALAVTVKDAGSNPVSGVNVTFTAPGSGASGVFGNNTATIIVATNASGVASAPFTANATAGGPYSVTAAATGLTTVNFSLTNTAGAAASMTANAGTTPQSATINTAFANALAVTVKDAGSNPVSGVNVTFTAPGSGASGKFSNNTATITVATNASGVASAPFTANGTAGGPYTVTAAATGLTSVNFSLTNLTGAAASMTANAGTTPQSAAVNTAFANALAVTVKDAGSNPISGVNVTFTAPGSGASGVFSNNTATIIVATNASGVASAPFTANATAGGPYTVTAAAAGVATVNFSLTNTAGTPTSMTANAGTTPQSATINAAFANALAVTVKDASSNPVSGVNVTFTAPASGASGKFSNNTVTINVATDASGVASAPFTANATVGGPYTVTTAAAGLTAVNFSLTNTTGPAAKLAFSVQPTNVAAGSSIAPAVQVTVQDAGGNTVTTATNSITMAIGTNPSGGALSGTTSVAAVNGVATFANLSINKSGTGYTLAASATGLTGTTSSAFNVVAGAATKLVFAVQPSNVLTGAAITPAVQVTVQDALGNTVISAVNPVTMAIGTNPSAGTLSGTTTIAAANGIAAFSTLSINKAGTGYTLTASAAGLTSATSAAFNVNNPVPTVTSLVPANANAGSGILLLTINGTNFAIGATVTFGSDPAALVPVTNTGTVITVNIPAADLATGGMFPVVVTNPGPGGGPSAVTANSTFIVNNPVPTVGNAAVAGKTHISGGAAFTLTVTGTNFVSNSVVNFNGSAVTTHFGTATQLTADIPASAVAKAGNVNVTVTNPAPAGGTSAPPFVFTVDGFTAAGPANTNVADGKVAMIEIDVTPTVNGFTNPVTFSVTGLPKNTSFVFVPTSVTPNAAVGKTVLQVTTKAGSVVPPSSPFERPPSPLLRLLPLVWLAALLAGVYAMFLLRRTPQLRRYAAIVPLALLLLTGAVLAGCAGQFTGTPKGAAPLVVTATSGTMSQTANVTLTVQ